MVVEAAHTYLLVRQIMGTVAGLAVAGLAVEILDLAALVTHQPNLLPKETMEAPAQAVDLVGVVVAAERLLLGLQLAQTLEALEVTELHPLYQVRL